MMTTDASQLLAMALKKVDLRDGFSPAALGAKIGLTRAQAEAAARTLANQGVLVLGFDSAAEFSADFRRSRAARVGAAAGSAKPAAATVMAARAKAPAAGSPPGKAAPVKSSKKARANVAAAASPMRGVAVKSRRGSGRDHAAADVRLAFKADRDGEHRRGRQATATATAGRAPARKSSRA
jgi:hypothetical protein